MIVFLGPSLSHAEARKLAPGCTVLPPARQGDVWRALVQRPRVIVLLDGVFESQPSVWHHELLDALASGVLVFGAASMGALRAAELKQHGMVGVGSVYSMYATGKLVGDDEVALLHAGPEHQWAPFTVPLVQVRAVAARVFRKPAPFVEQAARIFFQERTWDRLRELVPERARARWDALDPKPDPKADDARACLQVAHDAWRRGIAGPVTSRTSSSLVRRRRLVDAMPGAFDAMAAREDASALAEEGLRRLVLAGLLKAQGVRPTEEELRDAERAWLAELGVPLQKRAAFLQASGLAEDDARALVEAIALELKALRAAPQLLPDGPSLEEGLALEARLRGHWARAFRGKRRR